VTIEASHGKARPTMLRSSDLTEATERDPSVDRVEAGRFAPGNRIAVGRGWKEGVRKLLPPDSADAEVQRIADDAALVYRSVLRSLSSDGPLVRLQVAKLARHEAVAGYFQAKAMAAGLSSDEGVALDDRAIKHGQRAERLAVTARDLADTAAKRRPDPDGLPIWREPVDAPDAKGGTT
jgi:hypothetical protein